MSGSEVPPVDLVGPAMAPLVRAIVDLQSADIGPYAVVGGVAVAVRIGRAHRATADVDAVVQDDRTPAVIEILRAKPSARGGSTAAQPNQVSLGGTSVEVLPVGRYPSDDELADVATLDVLYVVSHAWALDTASTVTVRSTTAPDATVTAPFATPAALVAMKLHAYQDRAGAQQAKRASDLLDIHALLTAFDGSGAIAQEVRRAPASLVQAVDDSAQRVLVDQAIRVRAVVRTAGAAAVGTLADEIEYLARRFLERLRA